jgi:hypothetical protein
MATRGGKIQGAGGMKAKNLTEKVLIKFEGPPHATKRVGFRGVGQTKVQLYCPTPSCGIWLVT